MGPVEEEVTHEAQLERAGAQGNDPAPQAICLSNHPKCHDPCRRHKLCPWHRLRGVPILRKETTT
jgi:hypothetical protein